MSDGYPDVLGVLAHFRDRSPGEKESFAEQVEVGSAIHLA
jgi:hypothetical protein